MNKINSLLPVNDAYAEQYSYYCNLGKKYIQQKNIAFLGLVRNLETKLTTNLDIINNLLKITTNSNIILFENDSTDNTKEILKKISNPNIIAISKTYNRQQYTTIKDKNRTLAFAEYRNLLKQYVAERASRYDFVIVCDMDFLDLSIDGCYNSFGWLAENENIDAIAGNSFEVKEIFANLPNPSLWNYDSWAFRPTWWYPLEKTQYINYDPMLWFGFFIPPVGSPIFPVNSAFGGMTIYKTEKFIKGQYSGEDCEHVSFHYSLKQNNQSFNLYLNPSQIMLV